MPTVRPSARTPLPLRPSSRAVTRRTVVAGAAALTAATLAGGTAPAAQPTPTATPDGEEVAVSVYAVSLAPGRLGPQVRPYAGTVTVDPGDRRVAAAAVELLLAGPDGADEADEVMEDDGSVSAIPAGVQLLSAELIDDGVVRVDLSAGFLDRDIDPELADRLATPAAGQDDPAGDRALRLRQAQVVFTLTQFETISAVELCVEGEVLAMTDFLDNPIDGPVTREAFEDVTPLILIEDPLPMATVPAEIAVSGSANTFEASLFLRLTTEDGDVLVDQPVQATSGSGTRGTFEATLTVPDGTPDGSLSLLGYEQSARDGSEVSMFEVPLRFEAGGGD